MRKSQAPSLKTKSILTCAESEKSFDKICNFADPEKKFERKRSTESILNLLSNLSDNTGGVNDVANIRVNPLCSETNSEKKFKTYDGSQKNVDSIIKTSFENNFEQIESSFKVFNVVFGKQTKKKHKTWEGNGTLEISHKNMILKDEDGKIISRAPLSKARKLEEGERFYLGSKEVELLDLINKSGYKSDKKNEDESASPSHKRSMNSSEVKKPLTLARKFQCPKSCYTLGMALPQPTAEHQWHFNQSCLPISPVLVDETLAKKLRPHQYDGVKFLYECIMGFNNINQVGAILADEMGLGKTLQCIALIWTVLKQGPYGKKPVVKKVLVVVPSSLIINWYNEFIKWLGRVKLEPFVVTQKNKPSDMRGPVMIMSYEMLVKYIDDVAQHKFDLLICDEGHRLKNSNLKTTEMLNRLNCPRRIILTGTPLQNDLQEFYALVNFVNPNILGTPAQFRCQYEEPILASRQPNAGEDVVNEGRNRAQNLKKLTSKFLLRRTRDILKNYLPQRHDLIVFCKITMAQKILYNSLIDSFLSAKEDSLSFFKGSSFLELITTLKKICSHPSLANKENVEEAPVIEVSGKIMVTINFLQELQATSPKEKVVIVSNSTQTLNLLEKILRIYNYSTCRLDGSTPTAQRNKVVEQFNFSYNNAFVFFLSSKAGGVGLNVTGASRLILFDSDWNPATDLQAISRIWRDGQKYSVYIYRLLTTGTIEEKIYQRQLSKMGLCEGTIDPDSNKSVKLSHEELKDIFFPCQDSVKDCLTHISLSCHCAKQGEIPICEVEEEEEEEEKSCRLMKFSNSVLKMSELFHWEHHGPPFNVDFLTRSCLKSSEELISFIFHNGKN